MTKTYDYTKPARLEKYRKGQEDRGMKRLNVWIPEEDEEYFKDLGELHRNRYRESIGLDPVRKRQVNIREIRKNIKFYEKLWSKD